MTRLLIRVQTNLGPRTIISQDFNMTDAWACSNALEAVNVATFITEESTPVNLKALLRRRKKGAGAVVEEVKSNVTIMPLVRKP